MTIIRAKDATAENIKPGQYVLFNSMFRDSICTKPYEVSRVVKNRVYYYDHPDDKEPNIEKYAAMKSAVFFTDTKGEAAKLREISESQNQAIAADDKRQRKFHADLIDKLIAKK